MKIYGPTPAGDAFMDTERGVWLQDYNIWDGQATKVVRDMHNGTEWVVDPMSTNEQSGQDYVVKLTKNIPNTEAGISLKKSVINLNKSIIDLSKKKGISLEKHRARVAVAMDYSGSMRNLYQSGAVQRVLTRLMPLALRFDDNGELDIWLFHNSFFMMPSMTLNNFDNYIEKVVNRSGMRYGGTSYAPVLEDILATYFNKKSKRNENNGLFGGLFKKQEAAYNEIVEPPVFLIFITDGENSDKSATNQVIMRSANQRIFIQFVGIGDETFNYLQRLDDLKDRPVDNTGFIKVKDFEMLEDEEVYQMLLSQYPEWLKAMGIS